MAIGNWQSLGAGALTGGIFQSGGALIDLDQHLMMPSPWGLNHNVSLAWTNVTINANNIAGNVFQATRAGSLTKVGFYVVSCSANATVDVRVETVGADGNPTGTLVGATTNVNFNITTSMTNVWQEVTLTLPATITRGQMLAVVISNTVSPGTFIIGAPGTSAGQWQLPYSDLFTASWAKGASPYSMGVMVDGTWMRVPGMFPVNGLGITGYGSTTNPDERGIKITLPFKARALGVWASDYAVGSSSDFAWKVYDDTGAALINKTWDPDHRSNLNSNGRNTFYFDSPLTIEANRAYRITKLPSTTNQVGFQFMNVSNAALMSAINMGFSSISTQRVDAGAWTDTATQILLMGLIIDQARAY